MCSLLIHLLSICFHSISTQFVFHLFLLNFQPNAVLVTKCRLYSIKYDSADYDYKDYVKISDIANSQPDQYILRLVLFIQGGRDANILLTTSNQPNFERDFVYEIGEFQSLNLFELHLKKKYLQFTHTVFFCSSGSRWY